MLLELVERIRSRLGNSAYTNEAAISHGVVTPILAALGWDVADPSELVPEFPVEGGRVDFALLGLGRKPVVFIEVKATGKSTEGISDEQLFSYAFKRGVQLCVLTDGRTWSVYFPAGQGSYFDRRVCRIDLGEDDPIECQRLLSRYLARDEVWSGAAADAAQRDHRHAAGRREAEATLPAAWTALIATHDNPIVDMLGDEAEKLCGFRPVAGEVHDFLRRLRPFATSVSPKVQSAPSADTPKPAAAQPASVPSQPEGAITYKLFGEVRSAKRASHALVDILRAIVARDLDRIPALADALRGPKFSRIARTAGEIKGGQLSLGATAEIAPDWLIGLSTSNETKMRIFRCACRVYDLRMPGDLEIDLPNA